MSATVRDPGQVRAGPQIAWLAGFLTGLDPDAESRRTPEEDAAALRSMILLVRDWLHRFDSALRIDYGEDFR